MKHILTALALVIVIGARGQVYALKYTSFQLYDSINHKYHEETPVSVVAIMDMGNKVMTLTHNQSVYFEVTILGCKEYGNTVALHCINLKSYKEWDIYVTRGENYRTMNGKSEGESWVYKLPINY